MLRYFLETARLAPEPPATPAFSVANAAGILLLARHERIESWLRHRMRKDGLPASSEPAATLRTWSRQQSVLGMHLGQVATTTVSLLAAHGIGSVLLKGAAYHALADRHPFFHHRPTGDVDLLVEPGTADRAWQLLRANGFQLRFAEPSVHADAHHLPTLMGAQQVSVEIHARATLSLDIEESWRRFGADAERVEWGGTTVRVAPAATMLWHSITHALGDAALGVRLRSLLTSAVLLSLASTDECAQGLDWLRRDGVQLHDARRAVPRAAVEKWIAAAAWLAGPRLAASPRAHGNPARDLERLLGYRLGCLTQTHAGALPSQRGERRMEEATLSQFGFGLNRLGHWHPRWQRPRRLASSLWHQLSYRLQAR